MDKGDIWLPLKKKMPPCLAKFLGPGQTPLTTGGLLAIERSGRQEGSNIMVLALW